MQGCRFLDNSGPCDDGSACTNGDVSAAGAPSLPLELRMSDEPSPVKTDTITFDDFAKVKLRVGRVLEAADHPNADKLLVLKVDLGNEQRQIVAGLRGYYTAEQLVGRNIILVANLAPRMMRGQESQGMLLAASNADRSRVIVLSPESDIEPGSVVS
jgi:methionyl-tRNA synthetase